MITKVEILDRIRAVTAQRGGMVPGRRLFEEETGITEGIVKRYWPRWGDAVAAAGLEPNGSPKKIGEEALLEGLVTATRKLGRIPTLPELRILRQEDGAIPCESLRKYFGTKADWLAALHAYCKARPELDDVLRLIPDLAAEQEKLASDRESDLESGYVYLAQLSIGRERRYKIGRATSVDRRMGQINLNLPESVRLVHIIHTDDAVGIERYWHQRYADRRTKGEWFELNSADVKAFKRRKFQ